jgi:hypothetical protein
LGPSPGGGGWRRVAVALLLGIGLEACLEGRWVERSPASKVAWWVADRGRDRVLGLDRALFPVRAFGVNRPLEVEAAAGGEWAVLHALQEGPGGERELIQVSLDGEVRARSRVGGARCLRRLADGRWIFLSVEGGLRSVDCRGESTTLTTGEPGCALAVAGGRLLVGTTAGRLSLLEIAGEGVEVLLGGEVGAPLHDLAPGPRSGEWWALVGEPTARLLLLDSRLRSRWEEDSGLDARFLVTDPRGELVWLADSERARARRLGPRARDRNVLDSLPSIGFQAGGTAAGDRVLLLTPGALLNLDARGGLHPGQGGFGFAVDLAAVPGP